MTEQVREAPDYVWEYGGYDSDGDYMPYFCSFLTDLPEWFFEPYRPVRLSLVLYVGDMTFRARVVNGVLEDVMRPDEEDSGVVLETPNRFKYELNDYQREQNVKLDTDDYGWGGVHWDD